MFKLSKNLYLLIASMGILSASHAQNNFNSHNVRILNYTSPESNIGENVFVFEPSMSKEYIQSIIDSVYSKQKDNQFGDNRVALLFTPGTYNVDVKVGYYTQVLGLGKSPDDVKIIGAVRTQDDMSTWPVDNGPGALNNFWRSVENVSIVPTLGSLNPYGGAIPKDENVWAVSQASPMRNVHIKSDEALASSGSLRLFDIGWSSGGYMANSKIDGYVEAGSQQQWLSRNSSWNMWQNGNWNIIDVGSTLVCKNISKCAPWSFAPTPTGAWSDANGVYPFTSVKSTPVIAEKPTLIRNENGSYAVLVPEVRLNSVGVSWGQGNTIALTQFYVAQPSDSADKINEQLNAQKHILFTPGVYKLSKPLMVNHPNTVLLGIGLPSLMPINGTEALVVNDVDGVKVAGFMFDAGTVSSPTLLKVGAASSAVSHEKNPTMLYDIFCRVGGPSRDYTTKTCMQINSNHVVGDNFWIWRADHTLGNEGTRWQDNKSDNGIIVNGNNVTIYGLAVEHFQKEQTIWNGESGRVYFYQSELPYDPPTQSAWKSKNGTVNGYPSYLISEKVKNHEAWGLGIYSYFRDSQTPIYSENAIETPNTPGISLNHMISVWLNGNGSVLSGISHIVNGQGAPAISTVPQGNKVSALDRLK